MINPITIQVVTGLMRVLGEAAMTSGIAGKTVNSLVQIGASLIEEGSEAENDLIELTDQVETMVKENREPTADEWAHWESRSDVAHDIIQNWHAS